VARKKAERPAARFKRVLSILVVVLVIAGGGWRAYYSYLVYHSLKSYVLEEDFVAMNSVAQAKPGIGHKLYIAQSIGVPEIRRSSNPILRGHQSSRRRYYFAQSYGVTEIGKSSVVRKKLLQRMWKNLIWLFLNKSKTTANPSGDRNSKPLLKARILLSSAGEFIGNKGGPIRTA